ncbi:MAG: peptidylprolyl isomerase [Vicinamibacteria bacterium]
MLIPAALAFILLAGPALAAQTPPSAAQAPTPEPKPTPDGAVIALDTTMGTIQIGLYAGKAPRSSRNFLNYAKSGFYAGTTFHRVIPGFMIQGGGMDTKMVEKPTAGPVRNEARNGLSNTRGSVAMARTNDPHSGTSQFFINVRDNAKLDFGISPDGWGYAVFGEVLSGMDVVDAIVAVPTTRVGVYDNVPVKPIVVTKVRVLSEPPAPGPPSVTKAGAPAARPKAAPARPRTTPTPPVK